MTEFKKGDRIRNVSDVTDSIPIGFEAVLDDVDENGYLIFDDADRSIRSRPARHYTLAITPSHEINPGDRVKQRVVNGPAVEGAVISAHIDADKNRWLWIDFAPYGLHTYHESGVVKL